jgi:hypothetical protein
MTTHDVSVGAAMMSTRPVKMLGISRCEASVKSAGTGTVLRGDRHLYPELGDKLLEMFKP